MNHQYPPLAAAARWARHRPAGHRRARALPAVPAARLPARAAKAPVTLRHDPARAGRMILPHLGRLHGAALLLAGGQAAAEHLLLATVDAALAASRWPRRGRAKAWLYQILIGIFTAAHGAMPPGPQQAGTRARQPAGDVPPASAEPGPAVELLPDRDVMAALQALPVQSRITVYLADGEGFTYAEIAEITGIPASVVASSLHQGRTLLRGLLAASAASAASRVPPGLHPGA